MRQDLHQEELFAGKFRMLKMLGRGAMGEVWLAIEEGPRNFSRQVAVKRLLSTEGISDVARQSFVSEAQALARLDHPNIVRLIELGESDDRGLYLVLDYVDGAALDKIMKKSGGLSPAATALVGREVAKALQAVHSMADDYGQNLRVVHRDVSPANILVGRDGRVRLSDFGVARITGLGGEKTETGVFKGKLPYMPPEQAMGEPFDGRADLFSLGVTLFEALIGARLRKAETQGQLIAMIATERAPKVLEKMPEAPPALAQALDLTTEFDADNRIGSAGQLASLLHQVLFGFGPEAEEAAVNELRERVAVTIAATAQQRTPWSLALSSDHPAMNYQSHSSHPSGPYAHSVSSPPPLPGGGIARAVTGSGAVHVDESGWPQGTPISQNGPITGASGSITRIASITDAVTRKSTPRPWLWLGFAALIGGGAAAGAWLAIARTQNAVSSQPTLTVQSGESTPSNSSTATPPPTAKVAEVNVPEVAVSSLPSASTAAKPVPPGPIHTPPRPDPTVDDNASPGTLQVVVNPWGNVTIDGRSLGQTPIAPVSLTPGPHTVSVTNPELGASRSQTIKVQSGKQGFVKFDLKKSD